LKLANCRCWRWIWLVLLVSVVAGCKLPFDKTKDEPPVVDNAPKPRIPNSNAELSLLTVRGGTLDKTFATTEYNYSISLVNGQRELSFLPLLVDTVSFISVSDAISTTDCVNLNPDENVRECARMLINGTPVTADMYGSWWTYAMGEGVNTSVEFRVFAEDGKSSNTYTVLVSRAAATANDASIFDLQLSTGQINEAVAANRFDYSATVGYLTKQIRIRAVPRQFASKVLVNTVEMNQGQFSQSIALAEGLNTINVSIIAPDGVTVSDYTLDITRQTAATFAQQAYLKASDTTTGDQFGHSIALEGDLLAVGAPLEDSAGVDGVQQDDCDKELDSKNCSPDSGAVYLFRKSGASWVQEAYIKAKYPRPNDQFGHKVLIEGGDLMVSAPFQDAGTSKLMPYHDCDLKEAEQVNCMPDSGAVYEFAKLAGQWTQVAYLKAVKVMNGAAFGWDMARDGDDLIVGEPYESSSVASATQRIFQDVFQLEANISTGDRSRSGAALVYLKENGVWKWRAYIKADTPAKNDLFGWSVAIQAENAQLNLPTTVAVGQPYLDLTTGENVGGAYVYSRVGNAWSKQALVMAEQPCPHDLFGSQVALSFDTLLVGAPLEDGLVTDTAATVCDAKLGNGNGAVYVFERAGANWLPQAYLKASNGDDLDQFGSAIALDGDTAVIGAHFEDSVAIGVNGNASSNTRYDSGAAYVFTRASSIWTQRLYLKASNTGAADIFGRRFALDGQNLAISAPAEASSATGINGTQTLDDAPLSGALYLFR